MMRTVFIGKFLIKRSILFIIKRFEILFHGGKSRSFYMNASYVKWNKTY